MNRQQSVVAGGLLIGLGIVWWLNLWWLIWPGALLAAGVMAYTQRRRLGRTVEAVQAGLWLIGLGVLFLLGFVFPGVLLLAGASILLRGREQQVDDQVQAWFGGLRTGRSGSQNRLPSQHTPVTTAPTLEPQAVEVPSVGKTTRL